MAEVAVALVVGVAVCPRCARAHRYLLGAAPGRADPRDRAEPWRWSLRCPVDAARARFVLRVDGRTGLMPAADDAEWLAGFAGAVFAGEVFAEKIARAWRDPLGGPI